MAKAKKLRPKSAILYILCPGCNDWHAARVEEVDGKPAPHKWNGDLDHPTLEPSLLVDYTANPDAVEEFKEWRTARRCHSFIRNGSIEFLSDCTHALAGQTVELLDVA